MNPARRAKLEIIVEQLASLQTQLESLAEEEDDALNANSRGNASDDAYIAMQSAADTLEEVISSLNARKPW